MYFTATFPYVMMLLLMLRGLTLPGALTGIKYYLYPKPSYLADSQVMKDHLPRTKTRHILYVEINAKKQQQLNYALFGCHIGLD